MTASGSTPQGAANTPGPAPVLRWKPERPVTERPGALLPPTGPRIGIVGEFYRRIQTCAEFGSFCSDGWLNCAQFWSWSKCGDWWVGQRFNAAGIAVG